MQNAGVVASVHSAAAAAAAAADVSASVTSPAVCFAEFLVLVLCKHQSGCVTFDVHQSQLCGIMLHQTSCLRVKQPLITDFSVDFN